jgi:SAM-dependent methyltransferase
MTTPRRRYLLKPPKLKALERRFHGQTFRLLDVGAGNHSASMTKAFFPECHYEGLDRSRDYNNDVEDLARMDAFHEIDLDASDLAGVPDDSYDAILMAHVIEHLQDGRATLRRLVRKLAPGGMMYVECPGPRSLRLPSMRGTLNFHDDPTHVRPFTSAELSEVLRSCGLRIVRAGTRRDWLLCLLTPVIAVRARMTLGYVPGGVFWDLTGFAEFVIAERPLSNPLHPVAQRSLPLPAGNA